MTKHTLNYGDGNDTVQIGSSSWDDGDDYDIATGAGNDSVKLYVDGTSWVNLGSGDDTIYINGSGTTTAYGGSGDDDLTHHGNDFDDGVAIMHGGTGNDALVGLDGAADQLYGDEGNDFLSLGTGNKAYGGTGDDDYWLDGTNQADYTIVEYANGGDDTIHGNFAKYTFGSNIEHYEMRFTKTFTAVGNDQNNSVYAMGGNDYFDMRGGNDGVYGGGGNDTIYLGDGNDQGDGGHGQDVIFGGAGNDTLRGGYDASGDWSNDVDTLHGGDGDDYIDGGTGYDNCYGEAGNDILTSPHGFGNLYGGIGNDIYRIDGAATLIEKANEGIDTIEFYGKYHTIEANIENLRYISHPDGTLYNFKGESHIIGNDLANMVLANDYVNIIDGMGGADVIYAQGGNDVLHGNDGNDGIYGDSGNDLIYGDAGNDSLFGGTGADYVYGGDANDYVDGGDGNDVLIGEAGNDTINGGNDDDLMTGGAGYDNLSGGWGNDALHAGAMNDYVYGDGGNDRLYGDGGSDNLYGGWDADVFAFASLSDSNIATGIDMIRDFAAGEDKIDISAIDANGALSGNQAFSWGGMTAPGAGHAGTAWGQYIAATNSSSQFVRVYGDVNGDGTADFSIDVMNVTSMAASDFLL